MYIYIYIIYIYILCICMALRAHSIHPELAEIQLGEMLVNCHEMPEGDASTISKSCHIAISKTWMLGSGAGKRT